jgi:RimJ/RimL family protein N-acetyltransferase
MPTISPANAPATLPRIKTQRLILRPIADDDLDILHGMLSDAETMRYWSTLPHTGIQQTVDWIASNRADMVAGTAIEYGVEFEGRLIGRATFWNGNELGYIFDKAYWGRGFASEALTVMIDYAYIFCPWPEIVAEIDPRNLGSLRLLERLGFQRRAFVKNTFCIGGSWADSLYFALSREAWMTRQQSRTNQALSDPIRR